MRQPCLWSTEQDLARTELWDGLSQSARSALVEQLVRIVVDSVIQSNGPQGRGGEHGVEDAAKPPRT
jgi:hypothetical protein